MCLLFAPFYQLQSPGDPPQTRAWTSSTAHQSVTRDSWSLALSPLSLALVCSCLSHPSLLITPFALKRSGPWSDNLPEADALTFPVCFHGVHARV